MGTLVFRWTEQKDIHKILEIERLSFQSPWDIQTFFSILSDEECYNITALYEGQVAGYCFAQVMKKMVHILNLAVHPDFRQKGISRALVNEIISFARLSNKSYVFLEVRKTNSIAQALYVSMGFTHVFSWQRYYSDTGEDASIMVKKLEGIR